MTAAQNIGAGCRGTRAEKKRRVAQMLEKFQLSTLADRLPGELSGGQQQRVALARIMAYQPYAVLLDEPFSAMDLFLKDQMQREMQEMLADYPGTVLFVSHSRSAGLCSVLACLQSAGAGCRIFFICRKIRFCFCGRHLRTGGFK